MAGPLINALVGSPRLLPSRPGRAGALTPGAVALLARCCTDVATLCACDWACCASWLAAAPMFPKKPRIASSPALDAGRDRHDAAATELGALWVLL
jgi:hypothetical protein